MAKPAPREDARIARSREALRCALLDLVDHRSYDDLTIREITDCAGLGYATFYRHYPTKGALLEEVAAEQIRDLVKLSQSVMRATNSSDACQTTISHIERHRSLWSALLTGGAAATVREEFILIAREIDDDQHTTPDWIPSDLACRFAASALVEVLTWWLERGDAVSAEDAAGLLDRLAFSPMLGGGF